MGRTCGEPDEIKKNTHPKIFTALFREQASPAEGQQRCHILNPVVGPEALTGSTRMKGGSATKILLEVVFSLAVADAVFAPTPAPAPVRATRGEVTH